MRAGHRRRLNSLQPQPLHQVPAARVTTETHQATSEMHRAALTQGWQSRLPLPNLLPYLYRSASAFSGGRRSSTRVGRASPPRLSTHSPTAAPPQGSPSFPGPFSSRLHSTAEPLSRSHPLVPDAAPTPSERVRWQSGMGSPAWGAVVKGSRVAANSARLGSSQVSRHSNQHRAKHSPQQRKCCHVLKARPIPTCSRCAPEFLLPVCHTTYLV